MDQVAKVYEAAEREELAGHGHVGPVMRRSAYVLSVAAVDSYFHERGSELLRTHALKGAPEAGQVSTYVQGITATDAAGPIGDGLIRYRLSYKTLVAPTSVDKLLSVCGYDTDDLWLRAAIATGSRPDRMRRLTEIVYDRRNLIAHESDWDSIQLDFRPMHLGHVNECREHVIALVETFDTLL
jgi:hypothetical protein